ncbi:MAG: alpha-galactosidase [Victivallaceae bacterium]|nr:alpha-galactosidase [Victivallaceae bacterium]
MKYIPGKKNAFDALEINVSNPGIEPIFIDRFPLFRIDKNVFAELFFPVADRENIRMMFYNDSANSVEEFFHNGSRPFLGLPQRDSDVKGSKSRLFTILYGEGNDPNGIFMGAVPVDKNRIFCTRFELTDESFSAECEMGIKILPGERIRLTNLLFYSGRNLRERLEEFTRFFGTSRKCPELGQNAGWSTWDYYLWQVSEPDVMENIEELKKNKNLGDRIKYIVIDDGWQHAYGEWEANYKFPGGMASTAEKIKAVGFTPGIWVGPFMQMCNGQIAAKHPEMIIRDRDTGYPVTVDDGFSAKFCFLDPTHPETISFLKKTFLKIKSWGYRYIKIDFLFFVYDIVTNRNGRLYDETKTPLDAIKNGVEVIRDAIGNDIILVGCGGFIPEVGTGLYDSCRVSFDISSYWSNNLLVCRDLALKSLFARNVWENDYDFLIVRGKETAREKKINVYEDMNFFMPESAYEPFALRKGATIQTAGEARVWASMLTIAGGSLVLGDRLKMLNDAGIAMLEKVLKYSSGRPGYPVDLFKAEMPNVWRKEEADGSVLVAVFNWEDSELDFSADKLLKFVGKENAFEIWGEKTLSFKNGLKIPPRDVLLFKY